MIKPNRTILSVPGHMAKMHLKASGSAADVVMIDLEDSVPEAKKTEARLVAIKSLQSLDWNQKTITVRINPLNTSFAFRDILDIGCSAGSIIDTIVIPKVNTPGDIHFLSRFLDGIEIEKGQKREIRIEASIETAQGLENASRIAKSSHRLKSLVFGIADYSLSVGARITSMSGHGEADETAYPGHRWHFPISRMVMAAKANGLLAIDAPFGDFKNPEGLQHSAAMACALGCDGKWVIHPDQIGIVNSVFTPSLKDIERAKIIVKTIDNAGSIGKGAVSVEGKMVDQATVRLARQLLQQAAYLNLS